MLNDFRSRGKISKAIRVLSDEHKEGVLALTDLIDSRPFLEILRDKQPEGQPLEPNCIQSQHPRTLRYHPAVFEQISARLVRKHAMKTHGSSRPSGLDADDWFRSLSVFGQNFTNPCKLVAKITKRLATSIIPPDDLIKSQKGTTQGDALAMAMYGIAILPLISRLHNDSLTQKLYADDGSVVG